MKIDLLDRARLEILNKRGPRYHLQDAEKDYFLAVILNVLYASRLKDDLVFKGGTAIYHCYLSQTRFSKDLDFTSTKKLNIADIEHALSGLNILALKDPEEKKFSLSFSVQYQGALAQSDTISIDINMNQKVLLEPKILDYRNYYGIHFSCPVMHENEILAEKIRTMNDRARPRDLYDVVMLRKKLGLVFSKALTLLAKKEMFKPLSKDNIVENLKISLDRFKQEMEALYYRESVTQQEAQQCADELLSNFK